MNFIKKIAGIFLLSILVIAFSGKKVYAEEADGRLTILGAQILKDTEDTKQSLRIGMKINYEGAEDFGMYFISRSALESQSRDINNITMDDIKSLENVKEVSYKKGNKDILELNTAEKTLIYGVSLNGIDINHYESEIAAVGFVDYGNEGKVENSIVRNVMDIAVESGEFMQNDDGSLVHKSSIKEVVDEVELKNVTVTDRESSIIPEKIADKPVVNAGATFAPDCKYNETTQCLDMNICSSGDRRYTTEAQTITLDLGREFDVNDYKKMVIEYTGGYWVQKSAIIYLCDKSGNAVAYDDGLRCQFSDTGELTSGNMNGLAVWGDLTDHATNVLDLSNGIPYENGTAYKTAYKISKIKLNYTININYQWDDPQNPEKYTAYPYDGITDPDYNNNIHIKSIRFVKKEKPIERKVDLSKVTYFNNPDSGLNIGYDKEKGALIYTGLNYTFQDNLIFITQALTSTFNLNKYNSVRIKMKSVVTENGTEKNVVNKLRLLAGDLNEPFDINTSYKIAEDSAYIKDEDVYTFNIINKPVLPQPNLYLSINGSPFLDSNREDDQSIINRLTPEYNGGNVAYYRGPNEKLYVYEIAFIEENKGQDNDYE